MEKIIEDYNDFVNKNGAPVSESTDGDIIISRKSLLAEIKKIEKLKPYDQLDNHFRGEKSGKLEILNDILNGKN